MPLTEDEISELGAMIAVARKRDVSFGLCLGKKPEATILEMHRMKAPDILERQARKAGETAKSACGMASVTGKVLTLKCIEPPPAGLVKPLKAFLKAIEQPMKVCIADADGNLLEEDADEDEEGEASSTEPPTEAQDDPDKARWQALRDEMGRRVEAAMPGAAEPDKMRKVWDYAQAKAEAGDFAAALGALKPLAALMAAQGGTPQAEPAAPDPNEAALAAMLAAIKEFIAAHPEQRAAVLALVQTGRDKAAAPAARAEAIAALKLLLDGAAAKTAGDPLVIWRDAREVVDLGISALQGKLSASPHPDLRRIAEFGLNGATGGNLTAMMTALMTFNGSSGAGRAAAGQVLVKRVGEYRQFLTASPVITLCEKNPFDVACSIRAPMLHALAEIERLAAA